jgi:hypothetical protein
MMLVKIAGMYNSLKCNSLPKGKRHHRGMPQGVTREQYQLVIHQHFLLTKLIEMI